MLLLKNKKKTKKKFHDIYKLNSSLGTSILLADFPSYRRKSLNFWR